MKSINSFIMLLIGMISFTVLGHTSYPEQKNQSVFYSYVEGTEVPNLDYQITTTPITFEAVQAGVFIDPLISGGKSFKQYATIVSNYWDVSWVVYHNHIYKETLRENYNLEFIQEIKNRAAGDQLSRSNC